MSTAVPVPPLLDHDLVARRLFVRARDAVFVRGVLEASEGLGVLFAEHGGELTLATTHSRARELDELIEDLVRELDGVAGPDPRSG